MLKLLYQQTNYWLFTKILNPTKSNSSIGICFSRKFFNFMWMGNQKRKVKSETVEANEDNNNWRKKIVYLSRCLSLSLSLSCARTNFLLSLFFLTLSHSNAFEQTHKRFLPNVMWLFRWWVLAPMRETNKHRYWSSQSPIGQMKRLADAVVCAEVS